MLLLKRLFYYPLANLGRERMASYAPRLCVVICHRIQDWKGYERSSCPIQAEFFLAIVFLTLL